MPGATPCTISLGPEPDHCWSVFPVSSTETGVSVLTGLLKFFMLFSCVCCSAVWSDGACECLRVLPAMCVTVLLLLQAVGASQETSTRSCSAPTATAVHACCAHWRCCSMNHVVETPCALQLAAAGASAALQPITPCVHPHVAKLWLWLHTCCVVSVQHMQLRALLTSGLYSNYTIVR